MEKLVQKNKAVELPFQAPLYSNQLITGQDLEHFRERLVIDIGQVIKEHFNVVPKKWLKSHKVRKLLSIFSRNLAAFKSQWHCPVS